MQIHLAFSIVSLDTTNAAQNTLYDGKERHVFSTPESPLEVDRTHFTLLISVLTCLALRDPHAILSGHHYGKFKSN